MIGERERANLVVRSSGFSLKRNFRYIFIIHMLCKWAYVALYALLKFFTHGASQYDLASYRTLLHSTACAVTLGD